MAELSNNSKTYLIQSLQERVEKNKCNCLNEKVKHYLELYSKVLNEDGADMRARQAEEKKLKAWGIIPPSQVTKDDNLDTSLTNLRRQFETQKNFSGGFGSGGETTKQDKKVGNILLGDTDATGTAAAAGSYLGGAGLSIISPFMDKLTKMSGLQLARKLAPRSISRQFVKGPGTEMAQAISQSVLGQLQTLSGYDFVNKNLQNIAASQVSNIMGGSGKPFAPIIVPTQKKSKNS